jgi:group II intron maturase
MSLKTRGHFTDEQAATKLIYLAIQRAETKWRTAYNWTNALRALKIHFGDRNPRLNTTRRLNPIVAGWINYYGRFYRTALDPLLKHVNAYLRRWAGRKYRRLWTDKRFRGCGPDCSQGSLAYSSTGARSARTSADQKSPVTGDCHSGICASRGLLCPRPPDSVHSERPEHFGGDARFHGKGASSARLPSAVRRAGRRG